MLDKTALKTSIFKAVLSSRNQFYTKMKNFIKKYIIKHLLSML